METRQLSELKATNPYLRLGTDVSELEKSIQTLGLIAPLVVSPENVILAGARRYQAMLNLGFTETPVMVVNGNALEKELVSIDENLVRKDLSKIEIESHLRRAKEIYQELFPQEMDATAEPTVEAVSADEEAEAPKAKKVVVLPAEKFLNMVSEKTGLSPKQIHEAINRDEMAASVVKEARRNGELSLSQTNEIVKLDKKDQQMAIDHVKELPVREIKKFVKVAKAQGVEEAIKATPNLPFQKEIQEIDSNLKKLIKKMKQLELEGMDLDSLPESTQDLFSDLMTFTQTSTYSSRSSDSQDFDSLQ